MENMEVFIIINTLIDSCIIKIINVTLMLQLAAFEKRLFEILINFYQRYINIIKKKVFFFFTNLNI